MVFTAFQSGKITEWSTSISRPLDFLIDGIVITRQARVRMFIMDFVDV